MENNTKQIVEETTSNPSLHFSEVEEKNYYLGLKGQLIKLLYLIEDELNDKGSAELYFYGFMFELKSANVLCKGKLSKVCVKMFGLFDQSAYKNMAHDEIKRQIFECKGIVEHLLKDFK